MGYWIKDSCDDGIIALQRSLGFIRNEPRVNGICHGSESEDKGVVHSFGSTGASSSAVAKKVSPVLESYCIPIVSSYATSVELDDPEFYPFFLRTVPEDRHQGKGIFKFLRQAKWRLITIV